MKRACVPMRLAFNAGMIGPVIAHFGTERAEEGVPAQAPTSTSSRRQASPSPTPAPTSPTCAPPPSRTATTGSSTARDLDHARAVRRLDLTLVRTSPMPRSRPGSRCCSSTWSPRGWRSGQSSSIDGGHEVNEVWFEDVRVPAENLVGEFDGAGRSRSSCSATSGSASRRPVSPSGSSPGSRGWPRTGSPTTRCCARGSRARERAARPRTADDAGHHQLPSDGRPHPAGRR